MANEAPKPKYKVVEVEPVDAGAELERIEKDGYRVTSVFGAANGRVVIIGERAGGGE